MAFNPKRRPGRRVNGLVAAFNPDQATQCTRLAEILQDMAAKKPGLLADLQKHPAVPSGSRVYDIAKGRSNAVRGSTVDMLADALGVDKAVRKLMHQAAALDAGFDIGIDDPVLRYKMLSYMPVI